MNDLERFKMITHFEEADYVPIFAFPGAPGMSWWAQEPIRLRLVEQGMPEWVGKCEIDSKRQREIHAWKRLEAKSYESWMKYWGTTGPLWLNPYPFNNMSNLKCENYLDGEYEILEYETGAVTKQVRDNDNRYSMPEFRKYHVRDRKSWEYLRDRMTEDLSNGYGFNYQTKLIQKNKLKSYKNRSKPLAMHVGSTYGEYRDKVGPYNASIFLYDEPELVHDMIEWQKWRSRTYLYPLIIELKPEILVLYEDCCYNKGMLLSPMHFREFCSPFYHEIHEIAEENGVEMIAVDCDGNVRELIPLLEECGVNALSPFEQKAGNDIVQLRKEYPDFIIMGGLEKEVVNEGNSHLIRDEIIPKVPTMIEKGGYFPNGDHGIQPPITFENLCKFMTLLHRVADNPEGEFPRIE